MVQKRKRDPYTMTGFEFDYVMANLLREIAGMLMKLRFAFKVLNV